MQVMVLEFILIVLLAIVAVLGVVGFILTRREKKKKEAAAERENVTENVADLNDRFNRARYMSEDGN